MLCCCCVAEFRLVQFDSVINEQLSEGLFHTATLKSSHCMSFWSVSAWCYRADILKLNKLFWNLVVSFFWFLLVMWTSCNELFNTFLVSGDVCDEGVLHSSMFKPVAFLSKLTSVKMCKHLRGVNAFVFFLMCSLKANPSCVPLGEMLDIDDLDPARLLQRKCMNDYVVWSVVATRQTMCGLDTTEQCLLWARFSLVSRQSTKRTSWSRKELVMLGRVSKVAETEQEFKQ